jgi:hypothetical protein
MNKMRLKYKEFFIFKTIILSLLFVLSGIMPAFTDEPPIAYFTYSPEFPRPGFPIIFKNQSTDPEGSFLVRYWDFGDGEYSTNIDEPKHTYYTEGTYYVRLTVYDNVNNSVFYTFPVYVEKYPQYYDNVNGLNVPYYNQFNSNLPKRPTKAGNLVSGWDGCGPSALAGIINYWRNKNNLNLKSVNDVYKETMIQSTSKNEWNMGWEAAANYVNNLKNIKLNAEFRILDGDETGWKIIRNEIEMGNPLLLRTKFSIKDYPKPGDGHIIAIVGKTPKGDYIVNDPAGHYWVHYEYHSGWGAPPFLKTWGHKVWGKYRPQVFGSKAIYKKEFLESDWSLNKEGKLQVLTVAPSGPPLSLVPAE